MTVHLTFEAPPASDTPAPTKRDIVTALQARPNEYAVVYRADRLQRAADLAARITDGAAYGPGFTAVVRKVGAECRVYARFIGTAPRGSVTMPRRI